MRKFLERLAKWHPWVSVTGGLLLLVACLWAFHASRAVEDYNTKRLADMGEKQRIFHQEQLRFSRDHFQAMSSLMKIDSELQTLKPNQVQKRQALLLKRKEAHAAVVAVINVWAENKRLQQKSFSDERADSKHFVFRAFSFPALFGITGLILLWVGRDTWKIM